MQLVALELAVLHVDDVEVLQVVLQAVEGGLHFGIVAAVLAGDGAADEGQRGITLVARLFHQMLADVEHDGSQLLVVVGPLAVVALALVPEHGLDVVALCELAQWPVEAEVQFLQERLQQRLAAPQGALVGGQVVGHGAPVLAVGRTGLGADGRSAQAPLHHVERLLPLLFQEVIHVGIVAVTLGQVGFGHEGLVGGEG